MKHSETLRSFLYAAGSRAAFVIGLIVTGSLMVAPAYGQTTPSDQETTTTKIVEKAAQEVVPSKSVVRGRAVYDDTNRPVRRARVILMEMNGQGPQRLGRTSGSGEFQIKDVPAASYFVMIDASGIITPLSFVDLEDAVNEKFNIGDLKANFDEVTVDGIRDVTVKVRARRGGAISGKVTYSDGDPAINVRVNVMRKKDGRLARVMTNLNPSALFGIQTDDRGIYRVAGLPQGEYIVSAAETVDHDGNGGGQPGDYLGMYGGDSLVVSYYPAVAKASDATVIQIFGGQEQNEVNITLVDRVLHNISGTVVTRHDSAPISNAKVSISSKDNVSSTPLFTTPTGVSTDEQGVFTFNEMPDGAYTLTIEPPYVGNDTDTSEDEEPQTGSPTTIATPKNTLTRKQQDVTVSGRDLTDVTIVLSDGASVSGIVTVEGDRPLPEGLQIMLGPSNGQPVYESQQNIQPDGKFTIDGVPSGTFDIAIILGPNDNHNYYVKTITRDTVDLMSAQLVIGEDTEINNVRVVLSGDAATLSGRILNPNGEPTSGVELALVPADPSRWRARAYYRYGSSKGNGEYSISGAPGDYLIIFLHAGDQFHAINEAWIRDRAASAQHVTLMPSQRKTLDLTVPTQ